jgi:hypothetical protein
MLRSPAMLGGSQASPSWMIGTHVHLLDLSLIVLFYSLFIDDLFEGYVGLLQLLRYWHSGLNHWLSIPQSHANHVEEKRFLVIESITNVRQFSPEDNEYSPPVCQKRSLAKDSFCETSGRGVVPGCMTVSRVVPPPVAS